MSPDAEFPSFFHQGLPLITARKQRFHQGITILHIPDGNNALIGLQDSSGHDFLHESLQRQNDERRGGRQQPAKHFQSGQFHIPLECEQICRHDIPGGVVQNPVRSEEERHVPRHVNGFALCGIDHDQEPVCSTEKERQIEGFCRTVQPLGTQGSMTRRRGLPEPI